ncbi:MAG: PilT protein domain protein [Actinomycetia bacterium]|nr:PilT protein domain protein [Actinomycetes bacterium]
MTSRLLLDSHVTLWWLDPDGPISTDVRGLIDDASNEVVVSAASVWELGIKRAQGRLQVPDDMLVALDVQEIDILDVTGAHAAVAAELPMHHKDPFDRMLIAQALHDDYVVVTADRVFADYGVAVVSAR